MANTELISEAESEEQPSSQARLKPTDSTLAELQALMVESRQLEAVTYTELVCALSDSVAQLIATNDPSFAVAAAAFALRIREEHLLSWPDSAQPAAPLLSWPDLAQPAAPLL